MRLVCPVGLMQRAKNHNTNSVSCASTFWISCSAPVVLPPPCGRTFYLTTSPWLPLAWWHSQGCHQIITHRRPLAQKLSLPLAQKLSLAGTLLFWPGHDRASQDCRHWSIGHLRFCNDNSLFGKFEFFLYTSNLQCPYLLLWDDTKCYWCWLLLASLVSCMLRFASPPWLPLWWSHWWPHCSLYSRGQSGTGQSSLTQTDRARQAETP